MRAYHGISSPPDIILYDGDRSLYEHSQHEPEEMSVQPKGAETRAYELYDHIAKEAALMVPRPDGGEALAYYNDVQQKWTKLERQCREIKSKGVPDDIDKYGQLKAEKAKLEEAMDFLSWHQTAKVGYIYAKTTPRNAGKLYLRCSDPGANATDKFPRRLLPQGWNAGVGGPSISANDSSRHLLQKDLRWKSNS